jgi:hypothetical protein
MYNISLFGIVPMNPHLPYNEYILIKIINGKKRKSQKPRAL